MPGGDRLERTRNCFVRASGLWGAGWTTEWHAGKRWPTGRSDFARSWKRIAAAGREVAAAPALHVTQSCVTSTSKTVQLTRSPVTIILAADHEIKNFSSS